MTPGDESISARANDHSNSRHKAMNHQPKLILKKIRDVNKSKDCKDGHSMRLFHKSMINQPEVSIPSVRRSHFGPYNPSRKYTSTPEKKSSVCENKSYELRSASQTPTINTENENENEDIDFSVTLELTDVKNNVIEIDDGDEINDEEEVNDNQDHENDIIGVEGIETSPPIVESNDVEIIEYDYVDITEDKVVISEGIPYECPSVLQQEECIDVSDESCSELSPIVSKDQPNQESGQSNKLQCSGIVSDINNGMLVNVVNGDCHKNKEFVNSQLDSSDAEQVTTEYFQTFFTHGYELRYFSIILTDFYKTKKKGRHSESLVCSSRRGPKRTIDTVDDEKISNKRTLTAVSLDTYCGNFENSVAKKLAALKEKRDLNKEQVSHKLVFVSDKTFNNSNIIERGKTIQSKISKNCNDENLYNNENVAMEVGSASYKKPTHPRMNLNHPVQSPAKQIFVGVSSRSPIVALQRTQVKPKKSTDIHQVLNDLSSKESSSDPSEDINTREDDLPESDTSPNTFIDKIKGNEIKEEEIKLEKSVIDESESYYFDSDSELTDLLNAYDTVKRSRRKVSSIGRVETFINATPGEAKPSFVNYKSLSSSLSLNNMSPKRATKDSSPKTPTLMKYVSPKKPTLTKCSSPIKSIQMQRDLQEITQNSSQKRQTLKQQLSPQKPTLTQHLYQRRRTLTNSSPCNLSPKRLSPPKQLSPFHKMSPSKQKYALYIQRNLNRRDFIKNRERSDIQINVVRLSKKVIEKVISICRSKENWYENDLLKKAGMSLYDLHRLGVSNIRLSSKDRKYGLRPFMKKNKKFENVLEVPKKPIKRILSRSERRERKQIKDREMETRKLKDLESIRRSLLKINNRLMNQQRFWSFLEKGTTANNPIIL